jgi:hypothetical protein
MTMARKRVRVTIPVLAAIAATLACTTTSAFAAPAAAPKPPSGIYTGMGQCPLNSKVMQDPTNLQVGCVISVTNGGSVTIGSNTIALTSPITLQFGVVWPAGGPTVDFPDGSSANVYTTVPPANGKTLTADPLQVSIPGIANIIPGVTSVFAIVQLAGPITRFLPLATGEDAPVFVLPIKLHLLNALFGLNCYIGSDSTPILLKPTTGTTSPPPPATPITGDPGTIDVQPDPNGHNAIVASFAGARLVDNSVGVPGATGCGLFGALDPLINLAFGLPAAPGQNAVIFDDTNTSFALDDSISDLTQALHS